ncbi:uncharacterized protein BKCO1_26000105 [Diplodia corticola]|uniref:Uncharacterized protein n=1 Tax=Diplodia corticola TaxID=236234 RepID=A0A1J9S1Q9_9PEZI|nr:uncharacterized protein BKCO1_26000105 [Diplodia corticola]OJD33956.1 hypothetical protein BKCO1_26000105 [Diplodia corticola]
MARRAPQRVTAESAAPSSGSRASPQNPPRRHVASRRSRRQTTLTQYERGIPFAACTIEDSEDEFDEPRPKKRSRRSTLPGKTESQNTLTQIGWISTIPPSDSEENEGSSEASGAEELGDNSPSDVGDDGGVAGPASDEEFNGFSDGEGIAPTDAEADGHKTKQKTQGICEETSTHETPWERAQPEPRPGSDIPGKGQQLPHTPRKVRLLEVPSSQSPPVTPLSAIHTHERRRLLRSPLRSLSTNPQSLLDSPSRTPKPIAGSIRRSTRKVVAFKDQLSSSVSKHHPHSPVSSGVADSEDDFNDEEEEDGNEEMADAVAGIDIGQETQAYIRRIDFNCISARATGEPESSQDSAQEDRHSPPKHGSTNRFLHFEERAPQHPQAPPRQPAPASSQEAPPTTHLSAPTSLRMPAIKQEAESPRQQQLQDTTQDRNLPHFSSPVRHSQASSTTATPTQASPRPPTRPDTPEVPSSPPPQSSHLPETCCSHVSADDQIPPSQPTQLHLKQILLQPVTQTQTQDQDVGEWDRVPDSQGGEQHEEDQKEVAVGRVTRRDAVEGLVTATQMMQQGLVGEEFSLPPPPPWSQTQTQETEDED